MQFAFPFYFLFTSGYLVVTCGYWIVLLVTSRYFWFPVLVTTALDKKGKRLAMLGLPPNHKRVAATDLCTN